MDELLQAFATSISNAGSEYVLALGTIAIAAWLAAKAVPFYSEHQSKKLELEKDREARKAREEEAREERDRERSEMEGRWLTQYQNATKVQEATNTVIDTMREQMVILNNTLNDSKDRSHMMAEKVDDIHNAIVRKD